MTARLRRGNVLRSSIGILCLAGLAGGALLAAVNYVHIRNGAGSSPLDQIEVGQPREIPTAIGSAHVSVRPEPARTSSKLPPQVVPAISAAIGHDDARYSAKDSRGTYDMENPANHLAVAFASDGLSIRQSNTKWRMKLAGWGYDANVTPSANVMPRANANRIEYARKGLTEWYVNGPVGLEQGFRVAQAPWSEGTGRHTLALEFALKGNWKNPEGTRGHSVTLQDASGRATLRYGGLTAHDAKGRELTSWLELRDQELRLRVDAQGAEFPVAIDPTYSEISQLSDSTGPADNLLGIATAISDDGTVVAAGACGINGNIGPCSTTQDGAVYIFVEPAGGWATMTKPTAILTSGAAQGGTTGDDFGEALAMSGDGMTIAVAEPLVGQVFVFAAPTNEDSWASTFTKTAFLSDSGLGNGVVVGGAIGIDDAGDTIVCNAFNENTDISEADVFVRQGAAWASASQTAQLESSDIAVDQNFADAISISGDGRTVVVGASGAGTGGEAYVFTEPTSGGWASASDPLNESAKLLGSDTGAGGFFGYSTAIDQTGNTIVVGAIFQNGNLGEAYIYLEPTSVADWSLDGATLHETTRLEAYDATVSGSFFGGTAAISDDGSTIAIGSNNVGVYLFNEPSSGWPAGTPSPILNSSSTTLKLSPVVTNFVGNYDTYLGNVSGNTVASGAKGTVVVSVPGNMSDTGTIFVYSAQSGTSPADTISETSGSGQTATVNTQFSAPLVAKVVNSNGTGVGGITVTFAVPANGASGTFSGGVNAAVTDDTGTATSGVFTANSNPGPYTVTATATDVSGTASFSLTNQAALIATSIKITSTTSSFHSFPLPANDALVDGPPVTVNFTVTQASGSVTATGTVAVTDGFGDTCTTTTLSNGVGLCAIGPIMQFGNGSTTLTATYTPFANSEFLASSMPSSVTENLVEILSPCAAAGSSMSTPTPITQQTVTTVCLGGNLNVVLGVAFVADCVPHEQCSVSISPGTAGAPLYTVTLTSSKVDAGVKGSWPNAPLRRGPWLLTVFQFVALLSILMALQLARQRRTRLQLSCAAGVLCVFLLGGMSSCNGPAGAPPGTYTVDLTITAGQFQLVVPVTVTVPK